MRCHISCTGSIHIDGFRHGPGDEVSLLTKLIATAATTIPPVRLLSVDILPDTWCLDPDLVKAAITARASDHRGSPVVTSWNDSFAWNWEQYGVPIVEDAAEAIGSIYSGRRQDLLTFWSLLHGTKTITTGEGGMFVTNDKNLFDKVYNNHGRKPTQVKQFWPDW